MKKSTALIHNHHNNHINSKPKKPAYYYSTTTSASSCCCSSSFSTTTTTLALLVVRLNQAFIFRRCCSCYKHQNNLVSLISIVAGFLLLIFAIISLLAPSPTSSINSYRHHLSPINRVANAVVLDSVPEFHVPENGAGGKMGRRNLWSSVSSSKYYGCSNGSSVNKKQFAAESETTTDVKLKPYPDRYLMIVASGGLNQQRTGITDAVVAARILNATLVIPKLDQNSFWKDTSNFSDIFDVDWFISSLSNDVKIIKQLPKLNEGWKVVTMRVPRKCTPKCYEDRVLPILNKRHVVQLTKFDYRLSNTLATDLQKLRCRVNYHALKFTDPILKLGQTIVERMRMESRHFIALHLSQPNMNFMQVTFREFRPSTCALNEGILKRRLAPWRGLCFHLVVQVAFSWLRCLQSFGIDSRSTTTGIESAKQLRSIVKEVFMERGAKQGFLFLKTTVELQSPD